ncbi:MAG: YkgJ family cysteine cluster protein [Rubripirellula sp.]
MAFSMTHFAGTLTLRRYRIRHRCFEFSPTHSLITSDMPPRNELSLPTVEDCEGCGACCLHMGYPSYLTGSAHQPPEPHWVSLPDSLRHELEQYAEAYQAPGEGELDGPCVWFDLDTRRCKHHEHRPQVCRDFRIGSQDCLGWRKQYRDRVESN